LLLLFAEKQKSGEQVSIVTNLEVERVGSRAEVYLIVGHSVGLGLLNRGYILACYKLAR